MRSVPGMLSGCRRTAVNHLLRLRRGDVCSRFLMRMDGKIVLVTGASGGVGFAAARWLAELGAALVMVCRDANRGEAAAAEVAKVATGPAPVLLLADLLSQGSIRLLCDRVHDRFDRIDVLLNNAGAMFDHRE